MPIYTMLWNHHVQNGLENRLKISAGFKQQKFFNILGSIDFFVLHNLFTSFLDLSVSSQYFIYCSSNYELAMKGSQ